MHQNIITVPPEADYFTIQRRFDAPRVLIWKCYTEPQHLARFWGPRDAKTTSTVDLRVGGVWRIDWTYANGNPILDIALDCGDQVAVLLGNGDGTFQAPQTYTVGGVAGNGNLENDLVVGDFDGRTYANGLPVLDLARANYGDNTVSVLLNKGDGTGTAVEYMEAR